MLVQDFLRKQSPEKLQEYYGIKNARHEDGRVIFNYSQIDSAKHKTNPIVRECRGLVLDSNNNWELVAKSFTRFFNLGETDDDKNFDWTSFQSFDKEDGSLIIIYYWNGEWHLNTRNSYGDGEVGCSGMTWRELFTKAVPNWQELDKSLTYSFELCSRYNKIVRDYETPTAFLLSAHYQDEELDSGSLFSYASMYDLNLVQGRIFNSEAEVQSYLEKIENEDPTFEGFVLRDKNDNRLKVKSSSYVSLHRLSNNGNIAHIKNILPLIINDELDEVLTYFPEMEDRISKVKSKLQEFEEDLNNYWFCFHDEKSQKRFALAVKDCKLSSCLFEARKNGITPVEAMYNNPERLIKLLGD